MLAEVRRVPRTTTIGEVAEKVGASPDKVALVLMGLLLDGRLARRSRRSR